jgi:hypothetical protein
MSTSTESSFMSMQRVVRIIVTVTVLFALLLAIDPPFSVLGMVLSTLVMALLVVAVILLTTVIRPDRSIIQNLFK